MGHGYVTEAAQGPEEFGYDEISFESDFCKSLCQESCPNIGSWQKSERIMKERSSSM